MNPVCECGRAVEVEGDTCHCQNPECRHRGVICLYRNWPAWGVPRSSTLDVC